MDDERRPTEERLRSILDATSTFLDTVRDARHVRRNVQALRRPRNAMFAAAVALNDALGRTPFGDDAIRQPQGWDLKTGILITELAVHFEALVTCGRGIGPPIWGLRKWDRDERGMPVPGTDLHIPIGDIRYEPFVFTESVDAVLAEIEQIVGKIEQALGAKPDEWGEPIECKQAELARAFGTTPHRAKYIQTLAAQDPPPIKELGKVGTLYRLQVRDLEVRKRLLDEVERRKRRTGT
jgi:hypothetical protein